MNRASSANQSFVGRNKYYRIDQCLNKNNRIFIYTHSLGNAKQIFNYSDILHEKSILKYFSTFSK